MGPIDKSFSEQPLKQQNCGSNGYSPNPFRRIRPRILVIPRLPLNEVFLCRTTFIHCQLPLLFILSSKETTGTSIESHFLRFLIPDRQIRPFPDFQILRPFVHVCSGPMFQSSFQKIDRFLGDLEGGSGDPIHWV